MQGNTDEVAEDGEDHGLLVKDIDGATVENFRPTYCCNTNSVKSTTRAPLSGTVEKVVCVVCIRKAPSPNPYV